MNENEILTAVRELATELRDLPSGCKVTDCTAYKLLQSQPGKGGPLMQWFNRETVQSRKNIISDILGHFARTAYQQKPEFNQNAADALIKLCAQLQPPVTEVPVTEVPVTEVPVTEAPSIEEPVKTNEEPKVAPIVESKIDKVEPKIENEESKYQQAIALWNAGGLSWTRITEQLGEDVETAKSFSQAVKRFAVRTQQSLRPGKSGSRRQSKSDT